MPPVLAGVAILSRSLPLFFSILTIILHLVSLLIVQEMLVKYLTIFLRKVDQDEDKKIDGGTVYK